MKIDLHIHTEDIDIFKNEKRNFQGQINIPETNATLNQYGLTSDKSVGRETQYILNCWLEGEIKELNKIVDWIYFKIKDKAVKITIGDLRGRSDYCEINKEEILETLSKWMN